MRTLLAVISFFIISIQSLAIADPVTTKFTDYPSLRNAIDSQIQQDLQHVIKKMKLERTVKQKKLSIALVDITNPMHPRSAAINGDEMMYAASLPKIAILLGAFQKIHVGKMKLNKSNRDILTRMIRHSSNFAASTMFERVGEKYIADVLQSDRYRLYDVSHNGGLWVGKPYGKLPVWKRDPLHNTSHGATALQTARFYYLLQTGRLASPQLSKQMKAILADPAIHHKFVRGLGSKNRDARIYRKSGTWRSYHSDSAIIERDGRKYIAVALANHRGGERILRKLIVAFDDIIFNNVTLQVAKM